MLISSMLYFIDLVYDVDAYEESEMDNREDHRSEPEIRMAGVGF